MQLKEVNKSVIYIRLENWGRTPGSSALRTVWQKRAVHVQYLYVRVLSYNSAAAACRYICYVFQVLREGGEDEGVGGEVSRNHRGSRGGGGGERKGKVPSYLRSLWREMDQIMSEIERDTIEHQLYIMDTLGRIILSIIARLANCIATNMRTCRFGALV